MIRLIHAAGRSRFLLHEKATLLDLKVKININTGVQGHLQRLTYDAHGVNPILASDSAPLSSVGLGHGAVVWLVNKISACPQIATADSSHRSVKSLNSQDQQDFPTLQKSFPDSIAAALIDAPSSSPTRAHPAPTLWDSPPASAARLAASCASPVTTVPVESSGSVISPATQSSAQSCDSGGSRYSPFERIQRALRLAHLHEENRKWHEREAALLAWAHSVHPGPGPLTMSKLGELHSYLPDNRTRALGILRNTSPVQRAQAVSVFPS